MISESFTKYFGYCRSQWIWKNLTISAEILGLSIPKWNRIMAMLLNEGYISGGETWNAMDCGYPKVALTRPELTLKGLEYLEENSLMRKAADLAKGIVGTASNMI